jgi:type IV secretion system protein VirB4
MLNLAEYRGRPTRLADFLPWVALVAEGAVLNKDGSFQRTARFRGPDLDSATPAELVGVTARLNNALRRLGSGWAIFVEADRAPAQHYPHDRFPDAASALADLERQNAFEEAGAHFESRYFFTLLWLPPEETRRAWRAGSMKVAPKTASTRGNCCAASSIAPIAYCNWSRVSCPRRNGSTMARR